MRRATQHSKARGQEGRPRKATKRQGRRPLAGRKSEPRRHGDTKKAGRNDILTWLRGVLSGLDICDPGTVINELRERFHQEVVATSKTAWVEAFNKWIAEQVRPAHRMVPDATQHSEGSPSILPADRVTNDCAACGGIASNANCRPVSPIEEGIRFNMPALIQRYEFLCPHCGHRERGEVWISRTQSSVFNPQSSPEATHG